MNYTILTFVTLIHTLVANPIYLKETLITNITVTVTATGGTVVSTFSTGHFLKVLVLIALRAESTEAVGRRKQVESGFTLLASFIFYLNSWTFVAESTVLNGTELTNPVCINEKLFFTSETIVAVGAITSQTSLMTYLSCSKHHIIQTPRYPTAAVPQLPSHVELLIPLYWEIQVVVRV